MKKTAAHKRKPLREAAGRAIDFDELPTYVGYQVRRTQAKIFADFEATLANADFTPGSFGVLTLIRANPGITQVALAAAFGVDKSTMSPVIVRLEKRGLVRREVLASDRRCHALYLEATAEAAVPGRAREGPRLRGQRGLAPLQARAARAGAAADQAAGVNEADGRFYFDRRRLTCSFFVLIVQLRPENQSDQASH